SPAASGQPSTEWLGDGLLETRWTIADFQTPITAHGWRLLESFRLRPDRGETNDVFVFEPHAERSALAAGLSHTPAHVTKVSIILPTYRRPHTLLRTV